MRRILTITDAHLQAPEEGNGESSAMEVCMELMEVGSRLEVDQLDIYVSTHGGDVFDMLQIRDVIAALPEHININVIAMGKAMSAGFYLVAGAHERVKRYAMPGTTFMWHEAGLGAHGGTRNVKNYVEYMAGAMDDYVTEHIVSRAKMTLQEFNDMFGGDDHFLSTTDALKYGLIDEIKTRIELDNLYPEDTDEEE